MRRPERQTAKQGAAAPVTRTRETETVGGGGGLHGIEPSGKASQSLPAVILIIMVILLLMFPFSLFELTARVCRERGKEKASAKSDSHRI
jgi:hypothetical protein